MEGADRWQYIPSNPKVAFAWNSVKSPSLQPQFLFHLISLEWHPSQLLKSPMISEVLPSLIASSVDPQFVPSEPLILHYPSPVQKTLKKTWRSSLNLHLAQFLNFYSGLSAFL